MTATELERVYENDSEGPFRLTLSSGDTVDIDNPQRTIMYALALYIGQSDDPESGWSPCPTSR